MMEVGAAGAWDDRPMGTPMALQNCSPLCTMCCRGVQMSEEGEHGCSAWFTSSNRAELQAANQPSHDSYTAATARRSRSAEEESAVWWTS